MWHPGRPRLSPLSAKAAIRASGLGSLFDLAAQGRELPRLLVGRAGIGIDQDQAARLAVRHFLVPRRADAGDPSFPAGIACQYLRAMGHDRVDSRHHAGDWRGYDQHRFAGHADPGQRQALVDHFTDPRHADARDRSPAEAREHGPRQRRSVNGKLHPGLVPEERLEVGHRGHDGFSLLSDAFALVAEHVLHVQHPLHGPRDLLGGERLGHVVAGPEAHRRGRVGDAGITGDDQHRNVRLLLAEPFEELDSIHVGHLDVQQDDCVVVFRSLDQALPGVRVGFDLKSLSREDPPTGLAHDFLVVHHQQFALLGHGLVPCFRRMAMFGRAGLYSARLENGCNYGATRRRRSSFEGND